MPGADGLCVLLRQLDHRFIRPRPADKTLAGSFTECQPKLDSGHTAHQRLVDILDGFDEMGLAQDEIDRFRLFDFYGLDFHMILLRQFRTMSVVRYLPRAVA